MKENKDVAPSGEQPEYVDKIHVKPLPDILDEMDANIRAAAEAARRAEEAAKAAREAAKAATKASEIAEARADEVAKKALQLAELVKLAGMDAANAYQKRLSGKQK